MEILSAIAGEIAKYTLKPIVRQVGYLFFYKDNFKELKDQVEALGIAKERIVHEVEAERRNGREIEADVGEWLKKADTTLKEADGVCKDPRCVKADCSGWCFPNLISRHQLSRNAKKTVENVAKVLTNGKFDRIAHLPPLPTIITISVKLESRNKMKEEILLALKDPKLSRIGVYGLSGVGKTTLAGEIVEQVKHERLFDEVVMVTISQTADIDRIQDEMADKLGLRFGERSMAGKAGRLYDRITREKAILIILDDIYNQLNLDNLGIPSKDKYKLGISIEDNYKGCKLLLTSRDKKILENYDTEKNFRLEVLNDEESRRLFQNMNDDAVGDVELQDIAAQVTRSCAGLPVVIVTMAKALRNKGIDFWENALKKLESVDNGERVFEALQFSYNQLKDEEVKQVFLLCGVQGTSTYVSDLLKYVFGLGIFKQVDTVEDARIKLRETMADLKSCCLLLDHDATIKMHDTVCKVAIKIAFRDFYVFTLERTIGLQGLPDGDFLKRCSQINLIRCCIRQLPEKLDCPDLKFLHLNSKDNPSLEIPNSFFEGMRKLEVLDVTGMIVPSLPTSLVSLTKLKTLCLDHCYLKDMAGIGVLKNLKILSFIHSSMEEFPSEIGQLTHLKMLDLRNSGIEVIPPNIVSQLTKLEELYIGNALIKWGVDNSAKQNKNASLSELRHLTSLSTLEIQTETWILTRGIRFENLKRYKIVVGDKWEWPYYNETSRLLKLKLDTHIPSEHGIKMLIKRAEDLYLDEVNGISNVVFQLNGEGFPLLKHLHIQYNGEIQYIINSIGRNQTNVILFPKLETLILQNLSMLEEICHGPLWVGSFRELRVIKLKSCGKLEYVLLNSMIKEFSQLVEMDVSECPSVKNIVFMESMNSGMVINKVEFLPLRRLALQYLHAMVGFRSDNPALFFDAKVSLPNLDSLKLSSINLNKIWDDHQLSVPNSFQNLAHLIVEECGNLQYLFLPSMVENLKNLKQLKVSKCDKMEEIIATEGRNNEITLNQEAGFSKLEEIIINDMKNLKTAWHYQFGRLKTLEIKKCERLETIFPAGYMREALRSLETLKVCDCALVKEIFHLTANGMGTEEATTQLKSLVLHGLPKMKQIWSRDPQGLFRFFNLQLVQIEDCENLEYVFPFSIAKDLPQLDDLQLVSCGIKEVVSKKDGPMDETTIFELNHLTCVKLVRLHKLKGFYVGAHTLECQSLRKLFVLNCKLLKLFNSRSSRCQESPSYHQPHFSKPQPLFQVEEVIGNLHILALRCVDANMILQHQVPGELFCEIKDLVITEFEDDKATFPHWFLKNLPKLEVLTVMTSSFKEIFCDETLIDEEGQDKISTRVKRLSLSTLPELQDLCRGGSQIHPVLELLEILTVIECSNLRNLVPSSATFCHFTCMVITNCHSLKSLMTASTARSLVKLQTMKLEECKSLQKVVTEEVNETEHEIAFNSLLILELNYLPVLHSFSSSKYSFKFPWLERVVVSQCPRMQIFSAKATSTPKLKKVLIEEKACGEYYWQGDLNGTINNMYLNKVAFCSFVHLKVSDYPELGELWYGQVKNKLFCNLKSLVVQNCHWLSNFLLSGNILEALSNLKELEVRECVTLEAVFELGDINERGLIVREIKKITLSNLPKLKRIWNLDSQEIVSLGDAGDLAGECQGSNMSEAIGIENKEKVDFHSSNHLKLFSSNLLRLVQSLEELEVSDCGSLEVVFDVKIMDDREMQGRKTSQLKRLALSRLPNLKHIWNRDLPEILSFKNLQVTKITQCQSLKHLFSVSLCQDLQQLQDLVIMSCGIEEIVAVEGEGLEELKFYFPRLTIFRLHFLMRFKRFYPGRHYLECPSLKTLDVFGCEGLEIFSFTHLDSRQTLMVGEDDMPIQQALFSLEKVSSNLKDLALNEKDSIEILNGHYEANLFHSLEVLGLQCFQETPVMLLNRFLEKFPNIKTLGVRYSSFKVFFPSNEAGYCGFRSPNQIKKLGLQKMEQLEQIWNDDSLTDVLEELIVLDCPSLTSLGPPSIAFTSLTSLQVMYCKRLTFLMTGSTAKTLVHLKQLWIRNCGMMEVVVMINEGTPEEIKFESLEYLEMTFLPSLKSFCSGKHTFVFPSLEILKVRGCPRMQNFSSGVIIAPTITMEVENETRHCAEDFNTTIKQLAMEQNQESL